MTTPGHGHDMNVGSVESAAPAAGLLVSATLLQCAPHQVTPVVRSAAFIAASPSSRTRGYRWARDGRDAG